MTIWTLLAALAAVVTIAIAVFAVSCCVILMILLGVSAYFNYKHGLIILAVQDSIEESLDVLDAQYGSIGKILEKDIFFDSPEIRGVLTDISRARDSILWVANSLTSIDTSSVDKNRSDLDEPEENV